MGGSPLLGGDTLDMYLIWPIVVRGVWSLEYPRKFNDLCMVAGGAKERPSLISTTASTIHESPTPNPCSTLVAKFLEVDLIPTQYQLVRRSRPNVDGRRRTERVVNVVSLFVQSSDHHVQVSKVSVLP